MQPTDSTLRLEIVTDDEGFLRLRDPWTDLLATSRANRLFLTWEWLYLWWRHLGQSQRLAIVTVRSGDLLVALAPLTEPRRRLPLLVPRLEWLGSGDVGSDYLDIIVRAGWESPVRDALVASWLESRPVVRAARLAGGSEVASVAESLRRRGWRPRVVRRDVSPYIALSGLDWPRYLALLGQSHRSNFRRRLRRLMADHVTEFEMVTTEAARREVFEALVRLHNQRWQSRGGSTAFYSDALIAFHDAVTARMLTCGWLQLFALRLDGKIAAALYGFAYDRRFLFYQSAFDERYGDYSVGLVTMGLSIARAIDQGLVEYDLLHGEEAYKFLWARHTRDLVNVDLYPPTVRGSLHLVGSVGRRAAGRIWNRWLKASPSTPRPSGVQHAPTVPVVPSSS